MNAKQQLAVFLLLVIGGVVFEGMFSSLYSMHKNKKYRRHFKFARYIFLLLLPTFGIFTSLYMGGLTAFKIFLLFSLLGPLLEWCIGFSYQVIVGQKLWTYHRYSITGNTSLLAIPFWGLAGLLFYYLAQVIK